MVNKKYHNSSPKDCLNMTFEQSLTLLEDLIGKEKLDRAFDIEQKFPSPLETAGIVSTKWSHRAKIIGINPRITKTLWGIIKYAMTLPEDCVHIMPLWTPGIDSGFYAPVNFELSTEFYDEDLHNLGFDSPDKQLKLIVNLLHAMGKTVCFDALLHTERWSELVFIYPQYFEWAKLNKTKTRQYTGFEINPNLIYQEVQENIKNFLENNSELSKNDIERFYDRRFSPPQMTEILFGKTLQERTKKRGILIDYIREKGFETLPVTEHAPCRPIIFDKIVTAEGKSHAEFVVKDKPKEAKIFGALTPFKLYEIDKEGYPICSKKCTEVWDFLADLYRDFQKEYNFDMMRADMAHNQPSHAHKNKTKTICSNEEIWGYIKESINTEKPYFASLAEAFLNMSYYIDGYQDLENKKTDIVLGDLNYLYLNHEYIYKLKTRNNNFYNYNFKICATSFTNDSDNKENVSFYSSPMSCEIRYFSGLFADSPSYCAIGYEFKDWDKTQDEYFSALYTNYREKPFEWGDNEKLFENLSKIRTLYSQISDELKEKQLVWLNSENEKQACWMFLDTKTQNPKYLFAINLDTAEMKQDMKIYDFFDCVSMDKNYKFREILSLSPKEENNQKAVVKNKTVILKDFCLGEIRAYKIFSENKFRLPFKFNCKKNIKILLVSAECEPYLKSGGMADINRDFSAALTKKYKDIDLRIIIPLLDTKLKSDFELEDLNIKTIFTYGLNKSYAKLYKIKNPANDVKAYAVYSPAFSAMKSLYEGSEYNYAKKYTAYSSAVLSILKGLSKNKTEKFTPDILHLTDWTTGFVNLFLDLTYTTSFYKKLKTIITIHNTGYQGRFEPLFALLNIIPDEKILAEIEKTAWKEFIENALADYDRAHLNNNDLFDKINDYLVKNMDKKYLDNGIIEKVMFNTLLYSLKNCDGWLTDSESFYKELITDYHYATGMLFEAFYRLRNKGTGITCGLDPARYDSTDADLVKYPYTNKNAYENKQKNKLFVQEQLSKENIKRGSFDNKLINSDGYKIFGSLDKNPEAVLIFNTSRFDEGQKNITSYLKTIRILLKEHKNLQFLICIKTLSNYRHNDVIDKFLTDCEKSKLFEGRVVVIDDFVPVYNFMAASDILVMPSNMEPCGMVQMQAMRYGTIPVVASTGGLRDTVDETTGFKTDLPFFETEEPEIHIKSAVERALKIYNTDKWTELISNCMQKDVSWNEEKTQQLKDFYTKIHLK